MALGDFRVVDRATILARRYQTDAGNTAINAGEFCVQDATPEYVVAASDGASNAQVWIGVAATNDTVTASADGVVYVWDDPDYVFRGKPTTPANLASTIILDKVTLDVTSGVQTVDEDDTTNGTLTIIEFNSEDETIDVQMSASDHISN